jgi:hypothetical protein
MQRKQVSPKTPGSRPSIQTSCPSSQKRSTQSFSSAFFIASTKIFEGRCSARRLAANPSDYLPDHRTLERRIEGSLMDITIYKKAATCLPRSANPCESTARLKAACCSLRCVASLSPLTFAQGRGLTKEGTLRFAMPIPGIDLVSDCRIRQRSTHDGGNNSRYTGVFKYETRRLHIGQQRQRIARSDKKSRTHHDPS